MENKSDTHVRVQKNGTLGWLHKTTWKRIGEQSNQEGWVLVPLEPSEVLEIREKKMAIQVPVQGSNYQNESAIVAKNEPVKEEEIIKVKRAYNKKS